MTDSGAAGHAVIVNEPYRQWPQIQRQTGDVISPFWRAFFANFGASRSSLESARAPSSRECVRWSPAGLGIAYLLLTISWRLPDSWRLISLFGVLPLVPVEQIQEVNRRSVTSQLPNRRYSTINIVAVVIGGLLVLGVMGTLLS